MIGSIQPRQSQSGERACVSFGIFRPEEGCHIDEAVAHMVGVASVLERTQDLNVAILRSLDRQWAAVFAAWKWDSQNGDKSPLNLPEAAAFTKGLKCAVRTVDSGWFQLNSHHVNKGFPFVQLSLEDVVSVRRIYGSGKRQDLLSYSCLAILQSYFKFYRGLISYSFYDSLDGKRIVGLGIWDSVESALVFQRKPEENPAISYWKEVGAKKLQFDVCRVVYVTCTTPLENSSRPGFRI